MSLDRQTLGVLDLGICEYQETWDVQKIIHQKVSEGKLGATVVLVEHPDVLTLGKHSTLENITVPLEALAEKNISVVRIDRGGEVTAHMPGQLVVYPIVHLANLGFGAKNYINLLEKTIINTLKVYGLDSELHPEHPGVWCKNNKIAAVGVRIKNRVTMHGFSLNVKNSFEVFNKIIPCGIKNYGVTSMELECQRQIDMEHLKNELLNHLTRHLGLSNFKLGMLGNLVK